MALMLVHCILESLQSVTAIRCLRALTHRESCQDLVLVLTVANQLANYEQRLEIRT